MASDFSMCIYSMCLCVYVCVSTYSICVSTVCVSVCMCACLHTVYVYLQYVSLCACLHTVYVYLQYVSLCVCVRVYIQYMCIYSMCLCVRVYIQYMCIYSMCLCVYVLMHVSSYMLCFPVENPVWVWRGTCAGIQTRISTVPGVTLQTPLSHGTTASSNAVRIQNTLFIQSLSHPLYTPTLTRHVK
jgi:hypothetical protein